MINLLDETETTVAGLVDENFEFVESGGALNTVVVFDRFTGELVATIIERELTSHNLGVKRITLAQLNFAGFAQDYQTVEDARFALYEVLEELVSPPMVSVAFFYTEEPQDLELAAAPEPDYRTRGLPLNEATGGSDCGFGTPAYTLTGTDCGDVGNAGVTEGEATSAQFAPDLKKEII